MRRILKRISVAKSGSATAPSGYANTGVHNGDVNISVGVPVRTRYHQQVQRIAPAELLDRDAELAELAGFCTSTATAGAYSWWRADAWSGKSALMSWFVLHPPAGVRIVSFFVTARLAGQSDRAAFIDNLMEQLLALLGEGLPPSLTESTREAHLLGLLKEAAEQCNARGEQFVLLVDGLDEDRGVHDGPDAYSIAALLPTEPPAGMRVIVAGRPNPPIPAAVSADHPLRDGSIVRTLAVSPHAQAIRVEMERDLQRMLRGTVLERDLLGLVTAARGGLSAADLSELTGGSQWEIEKLLGTVTGRSFSVRDGDFEPGGPEVYLLGHEDLQVTAVEMLGPSRLAEFRDRLHAWAERYREQGWPDGTPEYLLRGYFHMLHETDDVDGMVACATDPARHDRMLDLSGGDGAALSEIATVQEAIAARDDPDLIAMVRLAVHRDHLRDRCSRIPTGLPAVWVALGRPHRAEALARSITDSGERLWALQAMALALAAAGDQDRAVGALAEAIAVATGDFPSSMWLARVVDTLVEMDEVGRAEVLAYSISDPYERCAALKSVVAALVQTGEQGRAAEVAAHAEVVAGAAVPPGSALPWVAEAMIEVGEPHRAAGLLAQAEALTPPEELHSVPRLWVRLGEYGRAESLARRSRGLDDEPRTRLARVARAMAEVGELDRAEALARTITQYESRDEALRAVVTALLDAGDLGRAESVARTLTDGFPRCQALLAVAMAMIKAHDPGPAIRLIDDVESDAGSITDAFQQALALTSAATALFAAGAPDRANGLIDLGETLGDSETGPYLLTSMAKALADAGESHRATVLIRRVEETARTLRWQHREKEKVTSLARALAQAGDFDRAQALCRTLDGPYHQGEALGPVMSAMVKAGEFDRAEAVARSLEGSTAVATAATAMAQAGEFDRAESLADTLRFFNEKEVVLTSVVAALLEAGERERATELAFWLASRGGPADKGLCETLLRALVDSGEFDCAEAVTRRLPAPFPAARMARVAVMMAETGAFDRAEAFAQGISDPNEQSVALASVARVMAEAGEHDRAAELVTQAESLARAHPRCEAFIEVARALDSLGERAIDLAIDAESLARSAPDQYLRERSLASVARALADLGEYDRVEAVVRSIDDGYEKEGALRSLACAMARAGDFNGAETNADRITRPFMRSGVVTELIEIMVKARQFDRAETLAGGIDNPYEQAKALQILAVSDAPRRAAVTARILALVPWHTALDVAIRLEPGVLATVLTETEALSPAA